MSTDERTTVLLTASFGPLLRSFEKIAADMTALAERLGAQRRLVLVVDDPSDERPTTLRGWLGQARAIMLHEFWMAAGEPERSPGARWVRQRR